MDGKGERIEGPFAEALDRNRAEFNRRFAQARHLNRRLDPEEFLGLLRSLVDPIVRACAGVRGDQADEVAAALYDGSLELLGHDCLGSNSRYPMMTVAWSRLLPVAAPFVADNPRLVIALISNAVYNLSNEPGARPRDWIDRMTAIAPLCTSTSEFLDAGKVAAWCSGMAHYRASALRTWKELPAHLQSAALGIEASAPAASLARALQDPWWTPRPDLVKPAGRKLALVARPGGFRGFGGPFIAPPEVTAVDGQFYVFDSECCWTLHADCFGATFQRFGRDLPKGIGPDPHPALRIAPDGSVAKGRLKACFEQLCESSSSASTAATLAVTLPRSHHLFLIAEVEGK
ncbi:MAG: hypothetical protein AB1714_03025 [Acidobacteriota bacterium]